MVFISCKYIFAPPPKKKIFQSFIRLDDNLTQTPRILKTYIYMPHWNCILLHMGLNDCCTVGWNLVQWWPVVYRNMGNVVLQFANNQVRIKFWFAMNQNLFFLKMLIMNNQVQSYQLWLLSGHKLQLDYLVAYLVDNDTENHQFRCSYG